MDIKKMFHHPSKTIQSHIQFKLKPFFWFLAAFVFLILYPQSPLARPFPIYDSGVFMYSADSILNGGKLYVDSWDNKPPLIFLIDALGLFLTDKSPGNWWGIWFLEFINLFLCSWMACIFFQRFFGKSVVFPALTVMLLGFGLTFGANCTEEFGLLFQWASILLFFSECGAWRKGLWIGLLGGLAFLCKPTLMAIYISIIVISLWEYSSQKKIKVLLLFSGGFSVGFGLPLSVITLWLVSQGSLHDCVDQLITYDRFYAVQNTFGFRCERFFTGLFVNLVRPGILFISATGYWLAFKGVLQKKEGDSPSKKMSLFLILVWPLEFLFAAMPGKGFGHYFTTLLPTTSILSAWGIKDWLNWHQRQNKNSLNQYVSFTFLLILVILFLCAFYLFFKKNYFEPATQEQQTYAQELKIIATASQSSDTLLIWGIGQELYFSAGRQAPTRYFFQNALLTPGYSTGRIIDKFAEEVETHPPRLIFDNTPIDRPCPPLNPNDYSKWQSITAPRMFVQGYEGFDSLNKFRSWVLTNYELKERVKPLPWSIYRLKAN